MICKGIEWHSSYAETAMIKVVMENETPARSRVFLRGNLSELQ
jgi:hypothetical protein